MKMTKKQADAIAERIMTSEFGVYGRGNFDLEVEELSQVIYVAANTETDRAANMKLYDYYKRIR